MIRAQGVRVMTTRALLSTVAASGLLWVAAGAGVDGAKPAPELPVVVDFGSDTSMGLYVDGGGAYTNGQQNVRAVILDNGNFVFDTNDSARTDGGRRIAIDFHGQAIAPAPAAGPHYADVFLGTLGLLDQPADDLKAMTAGGPDRLRRTRIGWSENGKEYSLRWDGLGDDGYFTFHCEVGAPCTEWTVTPTGPASLYLMTPSSKGKPATETPIGQYTMPFSITLTR